MATRLPRLLGRGGRHTDQGEPQSSKKAERKFSSVDALKSHMLTDAGQARDALKRAGKAFPMLGEI